MTYIIGIDPGPVTGVCLLRTPGQGFGWESESAQITPNALWSLIAGWVEAYEIAAVAAEAFVVSHRAARVKTPAASKAARDVLGGLRLAIPGTVRSIERTAAEVKPWAIDRRLKAAGLWCGEGMGHAHDAARHALFSACRDYRARDPLSRQGVSA